MKRRHSAHAVGGIRKKARRAVDQSSNPTPTCATHPVLRRLYPEVLTLRQYLLSRLSSTSKNRHRRISQLGRATPAQGASPDGPDVAVVQLLDSALVCTSAVHAETNSYAQFTHEREKDIKAFTQQRSQGTPGGTFNPGYYMQSEVGHDKHHLLLMLCLYNAC
jgi:hypothetical protein